MHQGTDIATGLQHHGQGRLQQAEQSYRAVLHAHPGHPDALHLLGLLAHQAGQDDQAAGLIRQAIAAAPRQGTYHANLGVVLLRLRDAAAAAAALRQAVRLQPGDFGAQANLGVALQALGDHDGAARAAGAALRLRPHDPATLCNRAIALQSAGRFDAALDSFDAALHAAPGHHPAQLGRGNLLLALGRTAAALEALDAAIALAPAELRARQARIVATNYLPGAGMAELAATARALAPPAQPAAPFAPRPAGGKLRIGYVSGDFRNHPVGYFLHAVLAARDPAAAHVTCYDNAPAGDAMTDRLRAHADAWRPIAGLDDDAAAALVRADGIDILVDLAGHTQGNRIGVFARRAAPHQVAWLGYFGTTGLAAMDAVIADEHVAPPGCEAHFTERVWRLPGSYLCFTPPEQAGPVAPLPAGATGPITFGCFNNAAKLNPGVLALWARVLAAVPGARLLLKSAQYADREIRRAIAADFARHGIAADRLRFEPAGPIDAMFRAYGQVDIALDPTPFAGGATTAQALWMGVPVISLLGETWPGRQGASLLSAAGFPQWVAGDADAYVALAAGLAADRVGLQALRQGLRAKVAASGLCDAATFARRLQEVLRSSFSEEKEAKRLL